MDSAPIKRVEGMIFAALRAHNLMEPMLIFTFLCMEIPRPILLPSMVSTPFPEIQSVLLPESLSPPNDKIHHPIFLTKISQRLGRISEPNEFPHNDLSCFPLGALLLSSLILHLCPHSFIMQPHLKAVLHMGSDSD